MHLCGVLIGFAWSYPPCMAPPTLWFGNEWCNLSSITLQMECNIKINDDYRTKLNLFAFAAISDVNPVTTSPKIIRATTFYSVMEDLECTESLHAKISYELSLIRCTWLSSSGTSSYVNATQTWLLEKVLSGTAAPWPDTIFTLVFTSHAVSTNNLSVHNTQSQVEVTVWPEPIIDY